MTLWAIFVNRHAFFLHTCIQTQIPHKRARFLGTTSTTAVEYSRGGAIAGYICTTPHLRWAHPLQVHADHHHEGHVDLPFSEHSSDAAFHLLDVRGLLDENRFHIFGLWASIYSKGNGTIMFCVQKVYRSLDYTQSRSCGRRGHRQQ